jgi:hypothetical protein
MHGVATMVPPIITPTRPRGVGDNRARCGANQTTRERSAGCLASQAADKAPAPPPINAPPSTRLSGPYAHPASANAIATTTSVWHLPLRRNYGAGETLLQFLVKATLTPKSAQLAARAPARAWQVGKVRARDRLCCALPCCGTLAEGQLASVQPLASIARSHPVDVSMVSRLRTNAGFKSN